ncbi:MAG: FIG00453121: hypothetical protein [uncultured Paraburkholderia sp.]|uniref:hypothetical protein n=1 Tax=uncultured Paraburkholderia sp. TaxID=1822466 RepID=UPI002595FFC3|nr:hypothetical protein [uncultured Paraburkholderia sp.]CAH2900373.1 MAG: FIG00453121: hypothetical protein [uncultured Paraburkholderia sp.]CAH2929321.1 MAG: FIG00453121: hypothetical protein [uncultured Paraburkholderia sp.]
MLTAAHRKSSPVAQLKYLPFRIFCFINPHPNDEEVEAQVDSLTSANRFMSGFFFGAVIATAIMVLFCVGAEFSPFMARLHALEQVIATAVISLLIADTRPVLYKTVWSKRRSSFILDEDLSATLRGRTFGIPAGVMAGILVQNVLMN